MKKILSLVMIAVFALSLIPVDQACARQTLEEFCKDKHPTKVYIGELTNSSGDNKVNLKELKEDIAKAFEARTKYDFEIVNSEKEADIMVTLNVTNYVWMETDPIDQMPWFATAYDAMNEVHYARIEADVKVFNLKSGRAMWEQEVWGTVDHATMTEDESYGHANMRLADMMMKEMLSTPKDRGILFM